MVIPRYARHSINYTTLNFNTRRSTWQENKTVITLISTILPMTMEHFSTLHQLAFNNAAQAIIIATVESGEIVAANAAVCTLLGYTEKALATKKWISLFKPTEPSFKKFIGHIAARGQAHGIVCIKPGNGKIICCDVTTAHFTDGDRVKRSITTLTDRRGIIRLQKNIDAKNRQEVTDNISIAIEKQKRIDAKNRQEVTDNISIAIKKQKRIDAKNRQEVTDNISIAIEKQKRIDARNTKTVAANIALAVAKSDQHFQLIFNSSPDVLYDIDLVTNIILLSNAYITEFGYNIKSGMSAVADWIDRIHPDDKAAVIQDYTATIAGKQTEWKRSYRFLRADQSVATILSSAIILRSVSGKAYRVIGSMQDISKQTVLEKKLKTELLLKEKQIAAAMLEAKETERSDIGKELHDNVNQLLGVSRLYLEMAKKGGDQSEMYMGRSSEYTMTAIEEIRKLTKGLTTDTIRHLGLGTALETIIKDTMEVNPVKISCSLEGFKEGTVTEQFKINLFRMVQEHLNNILKHAKATSVRIILAQNKSSITLFIADDGIGFDTRVKRKGIGMENIRERAAAFKGKASFDSSPGNGCTLTVTFDTVQPAGKPVMAGRGKKITARMITH